MPAAIADASVMPIVSERLGVEALSRGPEEFARQWSGAGGSYAMLLFAVELPDASAALKHVLLGPAELVKPANVAKRDAHWGSVRDIEQACTDAMDTAFDLSRTRWRLITRGFFHAVIPNVDDEAQLRALLDVFDAELLARLPASPSYLTAAAVGIGEDYFEAYHRARDRYWAENIRRHHAGEITPLTVIARRSEATKQGLLTFGPTFDEHLRVALEQGETTLVASETGDLARFTAGITYPSDGEDAIRSALSYELRKIASESGTAFWLDDHHLYALCPGEQAAAVEARIARSRAHLRNEAVFSTFHDYGERGQETIEYPELNGRVSISFGVAHAPQGGSTETLIDQAHEALRLAREA